MLYIVHKRHLGYFNRTGTTQPLRADVRSVWYLVSGNFGSQNIQQEAKMITTTILRLCVFVLVVARGLVRGDSIDDKMETAMNNLHIRGASLVFYDKVRDHGSRLMVLVASLSSTSITPVLDLSSPAHVIAESHAGSNSSSLRKSFQLELFCQGNSRYDLHVGLCLQGVHCFSSIVDDRRWPHRWPQF